MRELIIPAPDAVRFSKDEVVLDLTCVNPAVMVTELIIARGQPLKIRGRRKLPYVVIRVKDAPQSRVVMRKTSGTFVLSYDSLYRWIGYFARFQRDGAAEVDHIHLECVPPKGTSASFDLTPTVHSPLKPMMTPAQTRAWFRRENAKDRPKSKAKSKGRAAKKARR